MVDVRERPKVAQEPHRHDVTVLADLSATDPVDELEQALKCRVCGLRLLGLLISSPAWVHRRVESVSFRDHRTVRRRVSVDFSVPMAAPLLTINQTSYRLVPLTIMRRKSLVKFDLRDEADASVPLLGLRQNQAVTLALMNGWACAVLDIDEPSDELEDFLKKLVAGTQEEMVEACGRAEGRDATPELRRLQGDRRFKHIMDRLTEDFVLFALVPEGGPARRVYKFRYDEPLTPRYRESGFHKEGGNDRTPPEVSGWRREPILAALGWRPTRIRFPTPAAENARSFHFEVHAPDGVEIDSAKILAGRRERSSKEPSVDVVSGGFPTVDLHVIEVERGSLSRAQVDLRLARDSWLTLAAATAWLTAAALYWAANRLGQPGQRDDDAASALFITFTAALAAILWRPPEHRMAVRLLSRVGLLAYTSSLFLLIAAVLFVFEKDERLTGWLLFLGVLATVVAVIITVTWVIAVLRARQVKVLSPWEQGRLTDAIEGARHHSRESCETFDTASRHFGFDTPAIRVASAEADSATLSLDNDLVDDMRSLIVRRLRSHTT